MVRMLEIIDTSQQLFANQTNMVNKHGRNEEKGEMLSNQQVKLLLLCFEIEEFESFVRNRRMILLLENDTSSRRHLSM